MAECSTDGGSSGSTVVLLYGVPQAKVLDFKSICQSRKKLPPSKIIWKRSSSKNTMSLNGKAFTKVVMKVGINPPDLGSGTLEGMDGRGGRIKITTTKGLQYTFDIITKGGIQKGYADCKEKKLKIFFPRDAGSSGFFIYEFEMDTEETAEFVKTEITRFIDAETSPHLPDEDGEEDMGMDGGNKLDGVVPESKE